MGEEQGRGATNALFPEISQHAWGKQSVGPQRNEVTRGSTVKQSRQDGKRSHKSITCTESSGSHGATPGEKPCRRCERNGHARNSPTIATPNTERGPKVMHIHHFICLLLKTWGNKASIAEGGADTDTCTRRHKHVNKRARLSPTGPNTDRAARFHGARVQS